MSEEISNQEYEKRQYPYWKIEVEPGLKLRQLESSNAERIFELTEKDREYLQKWLPWPAFTNEVNDSAKFINSELEKRKSGEEYGYGIELDGTVVGHISLMHLKDEKKEPEIGYWIASEVAGKGITTKATEALTNFGIKELNLSKIVIRAEPGNIGSNKVAEGVGYKLSGQSKDEQGKLLNVWQILK